MGRLTRVASIHICMQLSFHEIFLTFFEEYWIAISFIFVLHYDGKTISKKIVEIQLHDNMNVA